MLKIVFTLFNLQGTDALPKGSFWIISHPNLFVKNFFRSFPNFSSGFFPRRSREQLGYSITSFWTCQELFSILFEVFRAVMSRSKLPLFTAQFFHYTLSSSICQELFSNSPIFSLTSAWFSCPRGQLRYITISHSICQAFFNKNWLLFLCSLIAHICLSITGNS